MIISKKRYDLNMARAVEEAHKQLMIEAELREMRRIMFEDLERVRNDVRRLEAKIETMESCKRSVEVEG